ncbi:hypothetical protein MLD38_008997 [Melastoma candidum]|uniref:Uncharacterized protein n=1 Tax=Melastoma candidum TaxID=119954 RepID=A0ACB9RZ66_9MYRT|nr:hypothetical protein MLD38_008997 [Melastoma candidum]
MLLITKVFLVGLLLTPLKGPMQKCEKMCIMIVLRACRILLKIASYWDLFGISATSLHKSWFDSSGDTPDDVVQARPTRFPLSSQELFDILDNASERTFLSGPTTMMQKYIFEKDAGKILLETKNLVAFTSFFLEQKLVDAWLADKDAEALKWQKLLVEEEEATQRRQAEILEKKRLRRLRQKEQKAKGHKNEEQIDLINSYDMLDAEAQMEASIPRTYGKWNC